MSNAQLLIELSKPFPPDYLSWKPSRTTQDGTKTLALAYADLRAYQERLDAVCGLDWGCKYLPWPDGKIICELTIHGVTRSSTGEADPQDIKNNLAGPVAEAMAFKRACAMFGLGRYLYDLPSQWVEFDKQSRRITDKGLAHLSVNYNRWYAANRGGSPLGEESVALPATPPRDYEEEESPVLDQLSEEEIAEMWEPKEKPVRKEKISKSTLSRLETLMESYYGEDWRTREKEVAENMSKGVVQEVKNLTVLEAEVLKSGLERRIAERADNGVLQTVPE